MTTPVTAPPAFASAGQRIAAFVLDGLIGAAVLSVVGGGLWLAVNPTVGYVAGGVALTVLSLLQWFLLGTKGYTWGKAALGLRVLDATTGRPLGLGRALVRQLVLGVLCGVLVPAVVMVFTVPKDSRRQGWHDKAAGSVEITVEDSAETGPVAQPVPAGELAGPVGPARHDAQAPTQASAVLPPHHDLQVPVTPQDRPTAVAPAPIPARTDGGMVGPPPGLVSRPAAPRGSTPAAATPPPAAAVKPVTPPPAAAVKPATPPPAAAVKPATPPPAAAAPSAPALPPTVASPRIRPPAAAPAPPPAVAPRRAPVEALGEAQGADSPSGWQLRLTSGLTYVVVGETLLGRDPEGRLRPGAATLAVVDPAFTVSKTHAALTPWGTTLWVEDLDSTHGVSVRRQGSELRVEPGTRTRLMLGDVLILGVFQIIVEAV